MGLEETTASPADACFSELVIIQNSCKTEKLIVIKLFLKDIKKLQVLPTIVILTTFVVLTKT